MPISRFALYFFALAACSTIAFASGLAGNVATAKAAATEDVSTAERRAGVTPVRVPPMPAQCGMSPKLPVPNRRPASHAETILAFRCLSGYNRKSYTGVRG